MKTLLVLMCGIVCLAVSSSSAGVHREIERGKFEKEMEAVDSSRPGPDRLRRAKDSVLRHYYSSLQVKAMAGRLPDDEARLEFATAAFPRTVDPENFYEVYDAFSSFSKVFRLHDRVRGFPGEAVTYSRPEALSSKEFAPIQQALKRESFDNGRLQLARQIFASSRRNFLSVQIRDLARAFDFEPARLEFAKLALDYTIDPEKYFLVNEAFTFENSRAALSKFVEERALKFHSEAPER